MSLIITCSCGKKLKIPESKQGKSLKCPSCGNRIQSGSKKPTDAPRQKKSDSSTVRSQSTSQSKRSPREATGPSRSRRKTPKVERPSHRKSSVEEKRSRREKTTTRPSEVTNRNSSVRSRTLSKRETTAGANTRTSRRSGHETGASRSRGKSRSTRSPALSGRSRNVLQTAQPDMGFLYTVALGGTTLQILTFLAVIGLVFTDPSVLSPAGFAVDKSNGVVLAGLFAFFTAISVSSFLSLFTVWRSASSQLRQEARGQTQETTPDHELIEEPGSDGSGSDSESTFDEINL